jgi:hypothetical protein
MSEVAGGLLFLVWAGLIILGMVPSLGARFGLWLRGGSLREPAPPPPPAEQELPGDPLVGKNLDRLV